MRFAASNIAWDAPQDEHVYRLMTECGLSAVEIAPTRWFPAEPYAHTDGAAKAAASLKEAHGLSVCSLQSIWYGRQEKLFAAQHERNVLLDYTRQAIAFAQAVGAGNLVFGCPRNRAKPEGADDADVLAFFAACGDEAAAKGTCFSLEANPPIYNTNYINTTAEAFETARRVGSRGCKVNVDLGTMIYYDEPVALIEKNMELVNHVHVSEPGLAAPSHKELLRDMVHMLDANGYKGFVSIEMGKANGMQALEDAIRMLAEMAK